MNSPADKVLTYAIHDVTPYINWIYFFHAWGFQPRFATIADIHGCDACRASWLTTFLKRIVPNPLRQCSYLKKLTECLTSWMRLTMYTPFSVFARLMPMGIIYCWTAHAFLYSANRSPIRMAVLFSASAILSALLLPVHLIR